MDFKWALCPFFTSIGMIFPPYMYTKSTSAELPLLARTQNFCFLPTSLEKALLLELVYPTTHTIMPATTDLKRAPKLIWLDTGLVNYAAEIQKEYLLSKDLTDTWRGMAAEQIVAQELKALSNEVGKKQKFWVRAKRGSSAEVDFVYIYGGKIIPIEVKNGHNAHLKSIHQFMNETEHDLAVRIWSGNYAIDEVTTNEGKHFKLINLPFYMIAALPNILKKIET